MPNKKIDDKTRLLLEFFESQGFKFVDAETREPILREEENG